MVQACAESETHHPVPGLLCPDFLPVSPPQSIQSNVLFNFPISPFPPGILQIRMFHGSELSEQNLKVPVGHFNPATIWPRYTLLVSSPSTPP